MKYEKFSDYMYYLLHAPLKRVKKEINQWYILFKILGKYIDDVKNYIYLVRETSMILSAPENALEMHGSDRGMPRLKGETFQNYRYRLASKMEVAVKAGTSKGIILALGTLGYQYSEVEPMYLYNPERWAEFIVYLSWNHVNDSGAINDITLIKNEINKVKPACGLPSYGTIIKSEIIFRRFFYVEAYSLPYSGTMIECGTHPIPSTIGKLIEKKLILNAEPYISMYTLPLCGTIECGVMPIAAAILSGRIATVKIQNAPMKSKYNISSCGTIYTGEV